MLINQQVGTRVAPQAIGVLVHGHRGIRTQPSGRVDAQHIAGIGLHHQQLLFSPQHNSFTSTVALPDKSTFSARAATFSNASVSNHTSAMA